jgi:hypothetical protein
VHAVVEAGKVREQRDQPLPARGTPGDEGIEQANLGVRMAGKAREQGIEPRGVDVVDQKPHPDAAHRRVAQCAQHLPARGVVGDQVGLEVDRGRGVLDRGEARVERERGLGQRPGGGGSCVQTELDGDVGERRPRRSAERERGRLSTRGGKLPAQPAISRTKSGATSRRAITGTRASGVEELRRVGHDGAVASATSGTRPSLFRPRCARARRQAGGHGPRCSCSVQAPIAHADRLALARLASRYPAFNLRVTHARRHPARRRRATVSVMQWLVPAVEFSAAAR